MATEGDKIDFNIDISRTFPSEARSFTFVEFRMKNYYFQNDSQMTELLNFVYITHGYVVQ